MSASIDERIVSMQFDNKQFESGVKESLDTIDKLKKSMKFDDSVKNLEELEKATNKLGADKSLSNMEKSLASLEKRFSAFGIVGMKAIENVTDSAMSMAKKMAGKVVSPINKAFSQIKTGGLSRALKIEDATFKIKGLLGMTTKSMKKVDSQVSKLMSSNGPILSAVKGTAYGLDAAAGAASNLLASGVKIKNLEGPLTAISGAAAMTGRSYEQIGNIFSTVAGQGKIMTMQLRQFEAANVNAAAVIAKHIGKTEAEVRDMVQKGKIDFQTFSDAMESAFAGAAKKANDTMEGALSNVHAALSRIGASIAAPLNEQKRLTYVTLIPIIDSIHKLLEPALKSISKILESIGKKFRGMLKPGSDSIKLISGAVGAVNIGLKTLYKLINPITDVLKGMWNIFKGIGTVLKPIAQAFLDIFPLPTLNRIKEGAKSFKEFTEKLRLSAEASETIRKIFRGVFQVLNVGLKILGLVWNNLKRLLNILKPLGSAFLSVAEMVATFVGNIAYYFEVVVAIIAYVNEYIGGIGNILKAIVGVIAIAIGSLAEIISGLLAPVGMLFKSIAQSLGLVSENASVFGSIMTLIGTVIDTVVSGAIYLFTHFGEVVSNVGAGVINWLRSAFGGALSWMADALQAVWTFFKKIGTDFIEVFKNTGSILEGIKAAFGGFWGMLKDAGQAIADFARPIYVTVVEALGKAFGWLADGFKAFASQITPGRIAALAFLAVLVMMSIAVKRLIDTVAYAAGIGAKAVVGLLNNLNKLTGSLTQTVQIFNDKLLGKGNRIPKFINILRELSKILLIVFGALYMLSTVDKDSLWEAVKAMGVVTGGLIALALAFTFLGKHLAKSKLASNEGFIALSKSMLALAASVGVLAIAFKLLDGVNTRGMIVKAIALDAIIAVLGLIAMRMAKNTPEFTKGCVGILFFALGVGRLVKSLVDLCQQPLHKVLTGLPIMLVIMLAFGHIAKQINNIKLPGTMSLIVMVIALKLFIKETEKLMHAAKGVSGPALVLAIGGIAAAIMVVAKLLKQAQDKVIASLREFGKAMILIAAAILMIAAVVKMFDGIKMTTVAKGLLVVAGIMTLIMGLELLANKTKDSKMASFGASLLLIAGAVGMLGGLVVLFGLISIPTITKGLAVIAAMFTLFAGLEYLAQFTAKSKPMQMGGMFMLMAGAIAMLAGVIIVLGMIDLGEVVQGGAIVGAIIALMSLLTLAGKHTAKANPKALGTMFLELAGAIAIMSGCIILLGKMDIGIVAQGGAVIAAFLMAMTILTHGLKSTKVNGMQIAKKTLASFLVILGLLMAVILAMKMLEGVEITQMGSVAAGLSAAVLALSGAMWIISKAKIPPAKSMLAFAVGAAALIPIAFAMAMLANIPWDGMLAGAVGLSACILAYGTAFMLVGKSGASMSKDQATAFLAGSLSLIVIAGALWIVAGQPWEGILAGAVGLSACLIFYGQVFSWISTCPKPDAGVMAAFLFGSLALLPIAMALMMVASKPWDGMLAAGAAISAVIVAYGMVFARVAKVPKANPAVMAIFIAGTSSLFLVAQSISMLASKKFSWDQMLSAAVSISAVILAYGLIYQLVAKVPAGGKEIFGKLVAFFASMAVSFDEIVVIVGSLLAMIGAIDDALDGKLLKWVQKSIPILKGIGEAVGGLIGELVGSFAEAVIDHLSNTLPHLGQCLSEFGTNAQPFFDILSKLPAGVADSALKLAETMAILGGASFLDGISNFANTITFGLFKGKSISEMGNDLVEFGGVIKRFQDATVDVKPESIAPVAEAAKNLASVSDYIGNSGGLFQVFTGTTDWDAFKNGVIGLIDAMKQASAAAKDINQNNIDLVAACGKALGEMSDSMPRSDGIFQYFTGDIDWYGFKMGVLSFVNGMVTICNVGGLESVTEAKIQTIKNCGIMLSEMADTVPNSDGIISWFAGNNDLQDFAPQIEAFGNAIGRFAAATSGINPGNVERGKEVSDVFIQTVQAVAESRLTSFDEIESFVAAVTEQIPVYGKVLAEFSKSLVDVDDTNVDKGYKATQTLLGIFQLMDTNNSMVNFKDFAQSIESFGTALRGLNINLAAIDNDQIDQYVEKITYLATSFNDSITGTDFKNVKGFGKTLEELNKVIVSIKSENVDTIKQYKEQIIEFGDAYKLFGEKIKDVKEKNVNTTIKMVNKLVDTFGGKKDKKMDFGNFEKLAKNMGKIADLAKIANKSDGAGNLNDLITSLDNLGKNSKQMVDQFNSITPKDLSDMSTVLDGLKEQFNKMGGIKTSKGSKLADSMKAIADSAKSALKDGLKNMDSQLGKFKSKGEASLGKFAEGLGNAKKLKSIKDKAEAAANKFTSSVKKDKFAKVGEQVLAGFIVGLSNNTKLNGISRAAENAAAKALKAFNNKLEIKSPSRATKKSAYFTVAGYTEGMKEYSKMVYKSGVEMGDQAKDGIKDSLDIHSPSGFSIEAAYNTAKGWILGCKDKAMEIFNSGFSFGGSFIDGLKKAIGSINKDNFSGDKMLDKIKDSLGFNKLGDMLKESVDTKKVSDSIGKGLSAGAGKGGKTKKAGRSAGKSFKDGWKEGMVGLAALIIQEIKGIDITSVTGKKLREGAKSLGVTMAAYSDAVAKFKYDLQDFDKTTQRIVRDSSGVVSSYIKKYRDASVLAATSVAELSSTYFECISDAATSEVNAQKNSYTKAIKSLQNEEKKYNKVLKNKKSTKKQKKEARAAIKQIKKEIENYTKQSNALSVGNILVNNFADALYKNSDKYKESKKKIESLSKEYQKYQKQAIKYGNIVSDTKKSNKQRKKAYDNLKKIQQKVAETRKNLKAEWDSIAQGPKLALKEWQNSIRDAMNEFTKFTNLDYSTRIISGFEKMEKASYVLDDIAQGYDILSSSASNAAESVSIFGDTASGKFDAFSASLEKTADSADGANGAIANTINILERFTKTGTVAKEALFENADSQLEAYDEFLNGLARMKAQGFDQALIDEMAKSGPSALNYIRGYMSMSAEEVEKYNERYKRKLEHENKQLINGTEKTTTASYREAVKSAIESNNVWEESLNELASMGVSSGIIKKIRDMGQEQGMAYVKSLKSETKEGITELNNLFGQLNNNSVLANMKAQIDLNDQYADTMDKLRNAEYNGQKIDSGFIKELESQSKEDAIAYGQSILDALEQIPTLNEYYAKLNQNDTSGSSSLLSLIKGKNAEIFEQANLLKDFSTKLQEAGANNNVLEYFESLDTEKAVEFVKKFNSDMERAARNNGVSAYMEELNTEFASFNRTGAKVMIDNMQSQIDAVDDYNNNMAKLAEQFGGTTGNIYYEYLQDMGTEGAQYVKSLAHATAEEIKAFQDMVDKQTEKDNEARIAKLKADQAKKYKTINEYGRNMEALAAAGLNTSFLQSIVDMGPEAGAQMAEMYANLLKTNPAELQDVYRMVTKDAKDTVEECTARMTSAFSIANAKEKERIKQANGNKSMLETLTYTLFGVEDAVNILDTGELPKQLEEIPKTTTAKMADGYFDAAVAPENTQKLQEAGTQIGTQVSEGVSKGMSSKEIVKQVSTAFSSKDVKKSLQNAGKEFVKGLKSSLNDKSVVSAAKSLGKKIVNAVKSYVKNATGKTAAKNLCLGLKDGIVSYKSKATNEAKALGKAILNAIKLSINYYDSGYEIGYQMSNGMLQGLLSLKAEVEEAAAIIATAAARAMKKAAKVKSPSRVTMEIGEHLDNGLIVGMENSMDKVESTAATIAERTTEAMRDAMAKIDSILSSDDNFRPTIKPKLDLSDVTAKASGINSMFNANLSAKFRAEEERNSQNQNGGVVQNFTQNNYSPKALSREEIYRQTKNQFAMQRRAVGFNDSINYSY